MNKEKVESLRAELVIKYFITFIYEGLKKMVSGQSRPILLLCTCGGVLAWRVIRSLIVNGTVTGGAFLGGVLLLLPVLLLWALLTAMPQGFFSINHRIARTKLMNSLGERPVLVKREKKGRYEVWTFDTYAVGLSDFQDNIEAIEAALDVAISKITSGDNGHQVKIELVPHPGAWPERLPWLDVKMPKEENRVILGENRGIPIYHDLAVSPHLFICSRTGGGKSSLIRNVMLQGLWKDYEIWLIDYKKGVDYSGAWKYYCKMVTTDEELLPLLEKVHNIMSERLNLLKKDKATNIDEYNKRHGTSIKRILLVFDETAECLDKTAADKQRKEFIDTANKYLSSLFRLGRAANISIILSTQRGGADLLTGSIRANIYNICGIADNVLSVMVLGNGDADKRIPKNARGRFLTEEGVMFQSLYPSPGYEFFPELQVED